jgi:DeoR/GlpR family transcriptional regulator of sugar metabolism
MLSAERNRRLRRRLFERGSIRVSEEAKSFGVSEETIRRDIKTMAAEGVADAVFGGAVLRPSTTLAALGIPPVDQRAQVQERSKAASGAAAAALVEPGQSVIIDAGTTTLALARCLRRHRRLTIITNAIPVAQVCADIPESAVYVIGGRLVPGSLSMIGPQAQRDLSQVSADWAFLGAAAVDAERGFTSADPYEAEVKRALIAAARETVILADGAKFGSRRFATFASAGEVARLLTTADAPAEAVALLESAGTAVTLCDSVLEETPS